MTTVARDLSGLDANLFDKIASGITSASRLIDTVKTTAQQATVYVDNPLKAAINSVEIRSAYSPPQFFTADDLLKAYKAPKGPPGIIDRIKPTLIIDSPSIGKKVIAPYGEASPTEWKPNTVKAIAIFLGGLALYTAGGYYLGYKAGQRSARR